MAERTPEQLALFAQQRANQATHTLYLDTDEDKPAGACDRNGSLVLGVCRVCGTYEAGLEDAPCPGARPNVGCSNSVTGGQEFPDEPLHQKDY